MANVNAELTSLVKDIVEPYVKDIMQRIETKEVRHHKVKREELVGLLFELVLEVVMPTDDKPVKLLAMVGEITNSRQFQNARQGDPNTET